MGVCKLLHKKWARRIDLIVVPYNEWACAILYFTGSGHYNRSMRLLARKSGMSLSQHSLNTGVIRHPKHAEVKLSDGQPLVTQTEEDVFRLLGLSYRPPCDRDA
jgi:DNA polymerase lambda